ncbi:MAG: glycosyl hydrolase family 18 protein [Bacilli bacterium]|nr:glycosyl hydrolase family 18 protein [Bacilli bacterium]MDD4809492.1 glycosyl hydrolase family 18 protein [Bacilli bacterium]
MIIHVVQEGETIYEIADNYKIDYRKIANDNEIRVDEDLVIGQTLVIINNGNEVKDKTIVVNGYTFTNIDKELLFKVLPSLTYLSIFSYHITENGNLVSVNDNELIEISKNYLVDSIMVVTNIGFEGRFDSDLVHVVLSDDNIKNRLINNILEVIKSKKYRGVNIDFEYIYPEDEDAYITFLNQLKTALREEDYLLLVALAPKTSDQQKGILYEAHNYQRIGEIVDYTILMTYEWGYSRGPARAVAPVNLVEDVVKYAVSRIPNHKILLGIPNYGYNWIIPYFEGSIAVSVGNHEAIDIARTYNQTINYDEVAQTPYFNYTDPEMISHEVWFEDARSIEAKLDVVTKYNLEGISYWTITRKFPQNYLVLNNTFKIEKQSL